jgi:predicted outer membrane protein
MFFRNKRSAILAAVLTSSLSTGLATVTAYAASEDAVELEARYADPKIARVVHVANEQIVKRAKFAQKHAVNAALVEYVNGVITEHERFITEFDAVLKKEKIRQWESATSLRLIGQGYHDLAMLYLAKGAEFDQRYLQQQIQSEQKLVDLLDGGIMASVQSPTLKDYLNSMRAELQQFIERANALQVQLGLE